MEGVRKGGGGKDGIEEEETRCVEQIKGLKTVQKFLKRA
jgi:hypothetical protein